MPTAEFHKPPTRQIENGHGQNPHDVDEKQAVTIPKRSLREVCDDGAVPSGLMKGERGQSSHDINEIEMQHIVKERHPAGLD